MNLENCNAGTICIQGGWEPKKGEARVLPIYQSTTFLYETSEQMGRLFDLEDNGFFIHGCKTQLLMRLLQKLRRWKAAWALC